MNAYLILYGPVKFTGIKGNTHILLVENISCYKYVEVSYSHVQGFILFRNRNTSSQMYIQLKENTTLEIKYNTFFKNFVSSIWTEFDPYPYCMFQYYSDHGNLDALWYKGNSLHYSVRFIGNIMKQLQYSEIAGCKWHVNSAFKTVRPQYMNSHLITFKSQHSALIQNDKICLCTELYSYNCTINEVGPIYPGETFVVKFAFPFAWSIGQYPEYFDIGFSSETSCQISEHILLSNRKRYKNCNILNLVILAKDENWCPFQMFTTRNNQHDSFIVYIILFPGCPMGFAKYYNKCDCDQLLGMLLTITCNINDRTILRPGNSWINATTNNYSHNYTVCQDCPFGYCLPQSSHLHLSYPNSQCQFNRTGLLCGQCQQGLSTVFGSSQCQQCSNIYLLFIILFTVLGILLVFVLFAINITVTDGTINAFVFYINIVGIDGSIFFPHHWFSYVFISIANLDWGMKTCFYNGMDDYAKIWLQLAFPLYLISIATSLIIASRYSTRIQRLTAHRVLPVLATLFLLSYTKMLRTTCNVLFLYSKVVYLPSNSTKLVWSVDANVPVFGVKFMILFITCLVLFSIMIPFNLILIFTHFFSRFKIVNKFKPLIDAYQGPYKDKCHYWVGLQLVIRATFLGLSSLDRTINLKIGIILITILAGVQGLLRPYKGKIKNYQEFFWLMNLQVLHVVSFHSTSTTYTTILVTIAMIHFSIVVFYHIITYTWIGKVISNCIYNIHIWFYRVTYNFRTL